LNRIIQNTKEFYYTTAASLAIVERTFLGKAISRRLKISFASSEISEQYQRFTLSLSMSLLVRDKEFVVFAYVIWIVGLCARIWVEKILVIYGSKLRAREVTNMAIIAWKRMELKFTLFFKIMCW